MKRKNKIKFSKKPSKIHRVLNKIFFLNTRRILIILGLWVIFVVAHDIISAIFEFEEQVFFILSAIVLPFYFLIAIIYFLKNPWNAEKE